ncbi:ABC transporter permease [Actinomadura sp. HBU206391]|uniref:ABC transporter permease n=1 Tax=Actinomadura sp. HBU206391 TaxID=2731692 RepID=UPI00164F834E|nr:ABC transporter permease [Actinomadura sp. HBU206391]MBC6460994.1 ABC transporter permease [Actinomadura sp. HBU206391]
MTSAPSDVLPSPAGSDSRTTPPATGGGLSGAMASEWTKVWSVRSTWWSLLAGLLLMAAAAAQLGIYTVDTNTNTDPTDDKGVVAASLIAIQGIDLSQFAVIALAMLAITAEYSTGTMRATLQWVPRRSRMLLAKTVVVAAVTCAAGLVMGVAGTAAGAAILGHWGSFSVTGAAGDVLAIGVYLALICVFTLGAGTLLRSAVGTLTGVFLLLTIIPATLDASDIVFFERISYALPGVAGAHFLRGATSPYPPFAGLLILALWAVAAVTAGYAVLRRRDA